MRRTGLYFSCKIGDLPSETFDVAEFTLNEGLSQLFILTLKVVSKRDDFNLDAQLLQKASLTVTVNDDEQRTISGLVAGIERGDSGFRRTFYTLTIRPEAWVMTLNQDSRIYHQLTVPRILKQLLQDNHVQANCTLIKENHLQREYVTQKRESSAHFFDRLAAEEGFVYWFDEQGMCYSDSLYGMLVDATVTYNPHPQSAIQGDIISQLRFGSYMRPREATHKDRNYQNPNSQLSHRVLSKQQGVPGSPHSVFDSYGRFQLDSEASPMVRYRAEQLSSDSKKGIATSNCIKLMPGRMFDLIEHPVEQMNDRWQVVTAIHHGLMPEALEEEDSGGGTTLVNEITFISARDEWRAPYHYKPLADGDEIAEVVGPVGEEIYVDECGAVKVHFHWNRYDKPDEKASCWVRVAQGWNGSGYGFLATPRIGQEVIVSYLNGDIDRPIITGCTYNAVNRTPLKLPAEKTRTTFKTKTHKGEGFNELRFEDDAGREEIYIHAQRDQLIEIKHDKTQKVENDESHTVMNNRSHYVGKDESLHIVKDRYIQIDNNQFETIEKDLITKINNNWEEKIHATHTQKVGEDKVCDIEGKYTTNAVEGIHSHTKTHTLQASEQVMIKGKAGTITINSSGITLTGIVTIKGELNVMPGMPGSLSSLSGAANEGQPTAEDCREKARQEQEGK